jgi:hypothetical protein
MKSAASILTVISLLAAAATSVRGSVLELEARAADSYLQNPSGNASFTYYAGCGSPGKRNASKSLTSTHTLTPVTQHVAKWPMASLQR